MNKKYISIALLSLLVVSCQNKINISENSVGSDDNSSQNNEQLSSSIYSTLESIRDLESYQLDYVAGGVNATDVVTPDYLYYQPQGTGLIKMENIDNSIKSNNLLYYFGLQDGEVNIKGLAVDNSSQSVYSEIAQLDPMQFFNFNSNYKVEESDFKPSNVAGSLYTDNNIVISIMASLLNQSSLQQQGYFEGVLFSKPSEDSLEFQMMTLDSADGQALVPSENGKGVFSNIGEASIPEVDAYLSENLGKFGSSLPSSASNILKKDNLHYKTTLKELTGNTTSTISTTTIDYTPDQVLEQLTNSSGVTSKVYYKRTENNLISEPTLNAKNEIKDLLIQKTPWSALGLPKDVFSDSLFRKISDTTYRFFGADLSSLLYAFFQADVSSYTWDYVDVILSKSGQLDSIEGYTVEQEVADPSNSGETTTQKYKFEVTDFKEPDPIPDVTTLKPIAEVTNTLGVALNKLKDTSRNIKISSTDDQIGPLHAYINYYYTQNLILEEKKNSEYHGNTYNKNDFEYTGYYKTDKGISNFKINKIDDRLIPLNSPDSKDSITNHWLNTVFDISSDVFELDKSDSSNKTFILRPEVDTLSGSFDFFSHSEITFDKSTLKFKIDDQNNLKEIDFTFVAPVARKETMTFEYGDSITIPDYPMQKIKETTDWTNYSSWSNETDVYNKLVSIFGKEFADNLPYVFDEDLSGNFLSLVEGENSLLIYNSKENQYYFSKLKAKLKDNGYSSTDDISFNKNGIVIEFTSSTKDGFTITKNS